MSKKNAPRKRKMDAVTDEELMPPPQAPVSKRHKTIKQSVIKQHNVSTILDISNISNSSSGGGGGGGGGKQQRQIKCGPLSIIFEKVQESEALHTKYYKELTNLHGKVSVSLPYDLHIKHHFHSRHFRPHQHKHTHTHLDGACRIHALLFAWHTHFDENGRIQFVCKCWLTIFCQIFVIVAL